MTEETLSIILSELVFTNMLIVVLILIVFASVIYISHRINGLERKIEEKSSNDFEDVD